MIRLTCNNALLGRCFFGSDASLDSFEVLDFVLSDALAELDEDFRHIPPPTFDMAIGEREAPALRMSARRKIPPLRPRPSVGRAPRRDAEVGIKDAVFMNAGEKKKLRRGRFIDLMFLGKAWGIRRWIAVWIAIDGLAQVV